MDSVTRQFYEIPGKIISFQRGEYLFYEGDRAKYFYIVRAGKIFITKYTADGQVLLLRLDTKGGVIGELPLYAENPVYFFNAVAHEPSEVYAINLSTLHSYLEKKPALAVSLLKILGQHMRKQNSKFRDLILYGKKGALYSTLIRLANSYGQNFVDGILIPVPLTNTELANYVATARETLNRMLGKLRRQKVIELRDGLIFIKDLDFLKREIHCENCGKEICNIE